MLRKTFTFLYNNKQWGEMRKISFTIAPKIPRNKLNHRSEYIVYYENFKMCKTQRNGKTVNVQGLEYC